MSIGITGVGLHRREKAEPFSPLTLADLSSWFRSDLGVTASDAVDAWADQGPAGKAGIGVTTTRPARVPGGVNGRTAINFTGSQKLVTAPFDVSVEQPFTMMVVCQMGAGAKYVIDNLGPNDPGQCAIFSLNGAITVYAGGGGLGVAGPDITQPSIVIVEFNGASSKVYVNSLTPAATGTPGANGLDGLTFGNYGAGGSFADGDVYEVVINRAISFANVTTPLMAYAKALYGIA